MPIASAGRGKWLVTCEVQPAYRTDPDERERHTRTVKGTRRDAESVLAMMNAEYNRAMPEIITMWDLAERYLNVNEPTMAHSTHRGHVSRWNNHIAPAIGELRITEVTPIVVEDITGRILTDVGSATARATHVTISAMLSLAVKYDWLPHHPLKGRIVAPRARTAEHPMPTDEQLDRLWEALADDPQWLMWFRLAWATGARPGELCALRWEDVNVGGGFKSPGTIHVNGSMRRTADGFRRGPTKTERGMRTIAIDGDTAGMLWEQMPADGLPWVFPKHDNLAEPITPDTTSRKWRGLRAKCGMDRRTRCYELRHRASSVALDAGFSVVEVAAHMGNTPAIVMETYGHAMGKGAEVSAAITKEPT